VCSRGESQHLPRKSCLFAANVYQQDELRGVNEEALFAGNQVELSPRNKAGKPSLQSAA
jgi:hypothetical protein